MKTIELNDGRAMPAFGLGTWKSDPGEVGRAVQAAVRAGYRHIDCAWIYGNEAEIGDALAALFDEGVVRREELWITSKLWNDAHAKDEVEPALRETLSNLKLDYLDLYLVHWPVALKRGVLFPKGPGDMRSLAEVPLAETWGGMEALLDAGLCRSIGVSNFSAPKLRDLSAGARIAPAVNQVELHPYLQQRELLSFCESANVAVTAYSPLGSRDRADALKAPDEPVLLEDDTVGEVAKKHGTSPAQVLIAWALARGTAVIPKSTNPARIRENLEATSITLDDEDLARIAALDRHRRYVDGSFWAVEGSSYTVGGLWDE
ncbi:MAG TPA: aldo/keto reductase [Sandaracinaceae bacterium LLY-WYZ-13_1]|nr:aldo/keto reductase [Sandaracinaceae bacterium LLY-WYZ-13_1]